MQVCLWFVLVRLTQVLTAVCVLAGLCYVTYKDVEKKISQTAKEAAIDIERCKYEYAFSNCDPQVRVHAAQDYCIEREKCMKLMPKQTQCA
jgi:hypothetical protein